MDWIDRVLAFAVVLVVLALVCLGSAKLFGAKGWEYSEGSPLGVIQKFWNNWAKYDETLDKAITTIDQQVAGVLERLTPQPA